LIAWNAPLTRARIVSGMTTAKIAPMLMSSSITPKPLRNSAAKSITRMSALPWTGASGTRASGAVNTRHPAT
jgi:hypothetical protein